MEKKLIEVNKRLAAFLRLRFLAQRNDLCGQLHVVYPGKYNHFCRSLPVERKLV
jgi:hypothetical protein